jgi:hypothetical protein
MKESKYQEKVLAYLKERGAWCFTSHGGSMFQVAGLPDVIGTYKGIFLGLELKTGKYQATELQKAKLNAIQDAGGVGMILRDNVIALDEILAYIDKHGKAPKQTPYTINDGVIIDE